MARSKNTFVVPNNDKNRREIFRVRDYLATIIANNLPESLIIKTKGKEGNNLIFAMRPELSSRIFAIPYNSDAKVFTLNKKVALKSLNITIDFEAMMQDKNSGMVQIYNAFIAVWSNSKLKPENAYKKHGIAKRSGRPFKISDVPFFLAEAKRHLGEQTDAPSKAKLSGTKVTKITATEKRQREALANI
mgnify:CR=1 FL=1|tara:strand:+ start:627 stop:1193 length:567 start_codon:yes stop_codon:yes gene_type:complete